ncbi:MAG: 30S ribosomal protein S17 [Patescibacteria group bacterium]|nr:30S ribosomal protein S17 [Patescibacteria group bacterium]
MPATAAKTEKTAAKPQKALKRQTFSGVVVSDKMKDTAVVEVRRYVKHAKYHKFQLRRTKIMAHDAGNTKKAGDKATIEACRPISKNKAFKVIA